jgi:predicted dehydrogenase
MYKIAILGCENSHADTFLNFIYNNKSFTDVEVIGVYSDEKDSAIKLNEKFGVTVAENYDEFVGKVDGIIITARNGVNHLKYAAPYIDSGIAFFIDKPITNSEEDAIELMKRFKASNCKFSGGSSVPLSPSITKLADVVKNKTSGEVLGGFLRAPVSMENNYGGIYFYSQHLVEMTLKIFGYYPKSLKAYQNGKITTVIVRYDNYDVTMEFTDGYWDYFTYVSTAKGMVGGITDTSTIFEDEFNAFYRILTGGKQQANHNDFIAPVFVINAIKRSLENNSEEVINKAEEI